MIKDIFRLPLKSKLRLAKLLLSDKRVPWYAKAIIPTLVLYLAMPLDIIPDFIPVLGQLDDILIAGLAGWAFVKLCPQNVVAEAIQQAKDSG